MRNKTGMIAAVMAALSLGNRTHQNDVTHHLSHAPEQRASIYRNSSKRKDRHSGGNRMSQRQIRARNRWA